MAAAKCLASCPFRCFYVCRADGRNASLEVMRSQWHRRKRPRTSSPRIKSAGVIKVSTDPAYPAAVLLNEDTNELEGFDIDVARRSASDWAWTSSSRRPASTPSWPARSTWDMSVGSVTITASARRGPGLHPVYYYTPAQMAVMEAVTSSHRGPGRRDRLRRRVVRRTSSGWKGRSSSR